MLSSVVKLTDIPISDLWKCTAQLCYDEILSEN